MTDAIPGIEASPPSATSRRVHATRRGELLERFDLLQPLVGETIVAPGEPAVLRVRLAATVLAGEQPALEREVRHVPDAELAAEGQHRLVVVAVEDRL